MLARRSLTVLRVCACWLHFGSHQEPLRQDHRRAWSLDPPAIEAVNPGHCDEAASKVGRSGYLPATVAEPDDHINASAERGDVGPHHVDTRDFTVLDLGDAGL